MSGTALAAGLDREPPVASAMPLTKTTEQRTHLATVRDETTADRTRSSTMATEPTLDLERLTLPISDDQPTGTYLKETDYSRFQEVKDRRAAAVAAERKQRELAMYTEDDLLEMPEEDRRVEAPDWRSVQELCLEILAKRSKDLWIAAWLVEANTRLGGFAGLRDAFQLTHDLVDAYWGALYPPQDEDEGFVETVSQLASLNGDDGPGTLIVPIQEIPLIPGHPDSSFAAYRQATDGRGGDLSEADFFSLTRQVDPAALRDWGDDISGAIDAFDALSRTLEARCGSQDGMPVAPSSSQIRNTLDEIRRTFRLITRDVLSAEGSDDSDSDAKDDSRGETRMTHASAPAVDLAQAQVNNREDAFRMLLKASEFFRKTEPHSPVSYMLQQAVRFGRMDLPELLKQLIDNEDVLKRFAERTGIEVRSEDDD